MISLFAGCSFTAGTGFDQEKDQPELWVNLLHNHNDILSQTELLNVSRSGRTNAGIFHDAVHAILHNNVKYAFVAWTETVRFDLSIGLEWYETRTMFSPGHKQIARNINCLSYPASYMQNINDRFTTLAHPHYEISNLVYYVNSLVKLCELKQCQIFFINALCDWDVNYFVRKNNVMPVDFTDYTKQLISIHTRDDDEIFKLYKKIHDDYDQAGGINENKWLNLYQSFGSTRIDTNNDNIHPGIKSNYNYFVELSKNLEPTLMY